MAESANNSDDDRLSCKILIIGAGMAGLSAANHLLKNNETDFLIVEARGRIGGRIVAVPVGTTNITFPFSLSIIFVVNLISFIVQYHSDKSFSYNSNTLGRLVVSFLLNSWIRQNRGKLLSIQKRRYIIDDIRLE